MRRTAVTSWFYIPQINVFLEQNERERKICLAGCLSFPLVVGFKWKRHESGQTREADPVITSRIVSFLTLVHRRGWLYLLFSNHPFSDAFRYYTGVKISRIDPIVLSAPSLLDFSYVSEHIERCIFQKFSTLYPRENRETCIYRAKRKVFRIKVALAADPKA